MIYVEGGMSELFSLIFNIQQIFISLLMMIFSFYFLKNDLLKFKESWSLQDKKKICLISIISFLLIAFYLFRGWGIHGIYYAFSYSFIIVLSMYYPKYAIGFFVYLLLSRPWEVFNNDLMSSMPRDISYLVILSLVGYKIITKSFYIKFSKETFLLLAFSFMLLMSSFFSSNSTNSLLLFGNIFTKSLIVFLIIQNGIESIQDVEVIKFSLILAIIEKGCISFCKWFFLSTATSHPIHSRLQSIGLLANSNDIAAIFVLVLPLVFYYFYRIQIRPLNWLIAIFISIFFIALIWETQSRGAILALISIIVGYAFFKIHSKKNIIFICFFALASFFVLLSFMNRSSSDIEGSTSNRIIFWKAGLQMGIKHPFLGVGFGQFTNKLAAYARNGQTGTEKKNMTAHSSWVLVFAESGFISLFLYLLFWLSALYRSWLTRTSAPEYFLSILGYGVCISFLSHAYLLFSYILLSLSISYSYLPNVVLLPSKRDKR